MAVSKHAMRVLRGGAALVVAALLSACAATAVQPSAAVPLPFKTIDQTRQSQIAAPRTVVVRDAASWARLWAEHAGADVAAPPVDFTAEMVVGVFLGTRESGCHATDIVAIERLGERIRVREADKVPGPAVRCMMMLTAPAHLVVTARSDARVEFTTETVML
jgi:hypothetical protein